MLWRPDLHLTRRLSVRAREPGNRRQRDRPEEGGRDWGRRLLLDLARGAPWRWEAGIAQWLREYATKMVKRYRSTDLHSACKSAITLTRCNSCHSCSVGIGMLGCTDWLTESRFGYSTQHWSLKDHGPLALNLERSSLKVMTNAVGWKIYHKQITLNHRKTWYAFDIVCHLEPVNVSESQARSGQNVDLVSPGYWCVSRGGGGGGNGHWRRGRSRDRRVAYDVTTHISDLSLKPHKQDGCILETGRPKVSNI